MSDTPILNLVPAHVADWRIEGAEALREMADQLEAGEITECVVVYREREDNCFASFGHFEDRWRLLGALEYAKMSTAGN